MNEPLSAGSAWTGDVAIGQRPGLLGQEVANELVIYEPWSRALFVLDPVATLIWRTVEQPTSLTTLCHALAERFSVTVAQVATDMRDSLMALLGGELLTVYPAEPSESDMANDNTG